ncbi:MAG: T9SS C-terminal target domain-containing protein, partial [Bacteroidetes bacterium]
PYLFPGEACSGSGWTPANAGLAPTDWRMVGTTGPISLAPGQRETLVFQFSVARAPSGMPDEAVCLLQDLADDLRQLHALEYVGCQLDGLVFPGDANHDQVANAWDLLSLGVAFGASGPARPQASLGWQGQIAPLWGQSLASGVDFRHVDTDGDGNITWADTLAINLNYGLVHASNKNQANGGVPLLIDMNIGTANPGDTLRFPIELGTADTMGVDVYGLAFQLEYDTAMVLPGSLGLDMGQSWLGTKGNDLLTILHQDHSRGTIDIGMVRNDHLPRTNYGPIGSLIVVLDDDIAKRLQPLTLSFVQANLIDPNEQDIPLAPRNNSLDIQTSLSNDWPADLAVFPNPAQSALYFRSARPDLREAQLIHPNGQLVAQKTWGLPAGELSWILPSLPSGLYFLRVRTQTGIHCRSMVIE